MFEKIIETASREAQKLNEGRLTYIDDKGLLRCQRCKGKLETVLHSKYIKAIDGLKVSCICKCGDDVRAEINKEIKAIKAQNENLKCFFIPEIGRASFDIDDTPQSDISVLTKRWVANYERNKASGNPVKWLFLYGPTGTGKTFYAACIANAMMKKGYTVKMTTLSQIESELFGVDYKSEAYKRYAEYELLILDDFGFERKSDYMYEIAYNIINERNVKKRPMIITTNMSEYEAVNPADVRLKRIMSRIWQYSYPLEAGGEDRRKKNGGFNG